MTNAQHAAAHPLEHDVEPHEATRHAQDLAGVAVYLASAVRDGSTTPDEAVVELTNWAIEDPAAVAPAAYLDAGDQLALALLAETALATAAATA